MVNRFELAKHLANSRCFATSRRCLRPNESSTLTLLPAAIAESLLRIEQSCLCIPFANRREWDADPILKWFMRSNYVAFYKLKHCALGHCATYRDLLGRIHWLECGQAVDYIEQFAASFVSRRLFNLFARFADKIHTFALSFCEARCASLTKSASDLLTRRTNRFWEFVATYCQINVSFRQELALFGNFDWLRFPRARENRLD